MSGVRHVTIDENNDGQRLDNFLITLLKVPRSRVYQMIRKGEARINKKRAKPLSRIKAGDIVRVPPVSDVDVIKSPLDSRSARLLEHVIYEDDHVLVLDKPAGLAVHGGSGLKGGVIEILRELKPEQKFLELAHRLDRGTSGCLLIAKSRKVLLSLHEQLREGQIKKVYAALVAGQWPKRLNRLEMKLEKTHSAKGHKVKVSEEGKNSISTFQVKETYADASLLEIHIYTGRTHQIRVQCTESKHPIIGDDKYGVHDINHAFAKKGLKRLCLHSHKIEFNLPDMPNRIKVSAPVPFTYSG